MHARASSGMHSCRQQSIPADRYTFLTIPVSRNVFLSAGVARMQECCRSPARKQHLGLPRGAVGAIDTRVAGAADANQPSTICSLLLLFTILL